MNCFQISLVLKRVGQKCMSDFIRSSDGREHEKCKKKMVWFGFCLGRQSKVIIQEGKIKINLKKGRYVGPDRLFLFLKCLMFLHRKSLLFHPRHLQVLSTRPTSTLACGGKKAGKKWVGEEVSVVTESTTRTNFLKGRRALGHLFIQFSLILRTNSASLFFLNIAPTHIWIHLKLGLTEATEPPENC